MTAQHALAFENVSKRFQTRSKTVQALREVNFTVENGEVFGFVGPNGAGKSTTIKAMLDIISDYEGNIRLYGVDARDAQARRGIAYVPESPALYEQFTPLEIMRMALDMYGIYRPDADAWCMQWLERFSVAVNARRRIRELSKGNVQRVALAHALVVQPRLLVLDEPLSGLDPVGRKDVVDILTEFKQQGGAIFFTSHVLHDVERMADRFGFINNGQLLTVRSPRELATEQAGQVRMRYSATQPLAGDATALRPGEYEQTAMQTQLPTLIAALNASGGLLLDVQPAVSLESVFFKILGSATANP